MAKGRDRIVESAARLLEPGEVIAHVVRGLEGPNRWVAIGVSMVVAFAFGTLLGVPILGLVLFVVLYTRLYRGRVILATDRGLHLLDASRLLFTPKRVLASLPVDTRIGPLTGLWLTTAAFAPRRIYVLPRTAAEAKAADAEVDAAD